MQKKTDRQKLIDFKNWLNDNHVGMYGKISNYEVDKYRKSIDLALGKPRPLTKNKQFDEFTDCWRCGDKAVRQNLCLECRDIVFKDV